jgi:hypothetical protein
MWPNPFALTITASRRAVTAPRLPRPGERFAAATRGRES